MSSGSPSASLRQPRTTVPSRLVTSNVLGMAAA
jgi:hypothetical protein